MKKAWGALFVLAVLWIAAMLHRGQPLGWDEVEFFRATKWTGEGQVPFRDFWEHHTPLQWLVFAPVARLLRERAGRGVDRRHALGAGRAVDRDPVPGRCV